MKCFELLELAALRATGGLDRVGMSRLEAMIAEDPDAAAEVAAMQDTIAAYTKVVVKPRVPPPGLRASILSRIQAQPQLSAVGTNQGAVKPGITFVDSGSEGWMATRVPGVRAKLLSVNMEAHYRVTLIELVPGARLPRHHHRRGAESVYVLSGDLRSEGKLMRAGDFMHSEAGTDHSELESIEGCRALVFEPVEGADFDLAHSHQ